LKPEWWGSPLAQEEKYQEKPVKREEIIIIIIITTTTTRLLTMSFFYVVTPCGPEDRDRMFLRKVGIHLQVHTASQPRTTSSSSPL
jgi:hypothetical protein